AGVALFVVAIATDWVDGRIARGRRLITDFGIFLDPIADKGLTGAALVCIAIINPPAWFWWTCVVLILVREWGITWWRAVALKDRVIPAGRLGKWKTATQGILIPVLLAFPLAVSQLFLVAWAIMLVLVAITLWSGIDYLVKAYGRRAR
ncbi:MAG: CDP-alcohol phosphatidyltransferase family protein, partial [Microbacteriaceae bacterium]|nr:CDP-alcohol phosphatidyltransferase family protein [Microbacteriaceae bacterium]